MRRLVVCLAVVCAVGLFAPNVSAGDEAKSIEHLLWESTVRDWNGWEIDEADRYVLNFYELDPFMTFEVPASPKSDALFFEVDCKVYRQFNDSSTRHAHLRLMWRLTSEVIPENIEVWGGWGAFVFKDTNHSEDFSPLMSHNNSVKMVMRKDTLDWWVFQYKDTGDFVPDEVAVPILNEIIKKGFSFEVWASLEAQGLIQFWLRPVTWHVTRLSKN